MCLCGTSLKAQTVAPLGGLGNIQFFDNNGSPLTAGVLYSYQAGTSTQQATYTDSSGTIQNPNPIPFGSGARVQVWLSIGSFYKFVLCVQNDGAACAAGDILFTVDQVPGGSTSSGGSSSSPFISGTANPATSGILRLASSDTICFRNAAGSTNICMSKDANDVLTWPGPLKMSEISAPSCPGSFDVIWADNSAHRWKMCNNGGGIVNFAASGVDINAVDQVIQLHFGAAAAPLGALPATNQLLQWNGSQIVGASPEFIWSTTIIGNSGGCGNPGVTGVCILATFPGAHTITRFMVQVDTAAAGCGTQAVMGVRDVTSSTNLEAVTISGAGYIDSGALSIAMTAGHEFQLGQLTAPVGCGTIPVIGSVVAILQ